MALSLKHRWFRFSVRTMFVLVLIVSMPLACVSWVMYEIRRGKEQCKAINAAGFMLDYELQSLPWYASILGEDSPRLATCIRNLSPEPFFENTQITDSDLALLEGLDGLQELMIRETPITDVGLVNIAGLTNLNRLELDGTKITDAGLPHFAALTHVNFLNLGY